jgi:N-acetylglucosaminyl-diphospho-decaprenol L-rhamnosyltransferase
MGPAPASQQPPSAPGPTGRSISVVIVTYNSAAVLAASLRSVRATLPGAEVIVVDNQSQDSSLQIARELGVDTLIAGRANVGYGTAANQGARAATRPLLLIMNPDARLSAVDSAGLAELMASPKAGLLACQVGDGVSPIAPIWPWWLELCWTLVTWFLVPREIDLHRPTPRRERNTWVGGAAFVVSAGEFGALGGFDESIFLYYEDLDLAHRYHAAGHPVGVTETITVAHAGRGSSPREESFLMACALLGLLQTTATWNGKRSARRAARLTLEALRLLESLGMALRLIPILGPRCIEKAHLARALRGMLLDGKFRVSDSEFYGDAWSAIAPTHRK